jgi:hypothetical protein
MHGRFCGFVYLSGPTPCSHMASPSSKGLVHLFAYVLSRCRTFYASPSSGWANDWLAPAIVAVVVGSLTVSAMLMVLLINRCVIVCVCACACMRACERACVCLCLHVRHWSGRSHHHSFWLCRRGVSNDKLMWPARDISHPHIHTHIRHTLQEHTHTHTCSGASTFGCCNPCSPSE